MLALGLAASAMAHRPEPNAYLNRPAHSTAELVQQAKSDPAVMDRYMRHYGMSRQEVIELLSGLHLAAMAQDTPMAVYNCSEQDGVIRSRLFVIKKGSWVFADASGRPVVKKTCGNPFWTTPPPAPDEVQTATLPATIRQDELMASVETMPVAELVEPAFEVPEPLPYAVAPPVVPETEAIFATHSRRTPLWPFIVGGVVLDHPGGGGGRRRRKVITEPPVPGPAGALAFGIPALAGALRRRRSKTPRF
ncbi:MAG: hypothetical protein M9921_05850 [Fimbriimonadaceae bacterium]|nr:hypothetical protein [Fimbriimonadaceae bacterium]